MVDYNSVYLCCFPTLTVFVDDQQDFLDSVKYRFKSSNLICFSNQKDALDYIKSNSSKRLWYLDKIKPIEEEIHNHKRIEYNLSNLFQKTQDKARFNIITSVIVDYDMPEINGIEFANILRDYDIDIYLLTGAADEKIAVDAFNKKLIKGYIPKLNDDTNTIVLESISNSSSDYFSKITNTLLNQHVIRDNSVLLKNEFKNFFKSLTLKYNIVEYYLNDLDLNFILIDNKGNLNLLFIYSESHLNSIYRLGCDEGLPPNILNDLKSKSKMICFYNLEGDNFLFSKDYKQYIYDSTKLKIENFIYYYKFIKNISFNKDYLSYNKFMELK